MSNPKSNAAYAAIVAEADRVGWPTSHRAHDLETVDKALIEKHPGQPFAWILRDGGTHFATPGIRGNWSTSADHFPLSVASAFGHENCRFYWWDGLRLIKLRTAVELSARLKKATADMDPIVAWEGC